MKRKPLTRSMIFSDFMKRIEVDWNTGCWNWTMYRTEDGYGRTSYRGRLRLAHRLSKYLYGELTEEQLNNPELIIMHTCDNPPCVNPYHLITGTQLDNIKDRSRKGRSARHLDRRDNSGRFKQKQQGVKPANEGEVRCQ